MGLVCAKNASEKFSRLGTFKTDAGEGWEVPANFRETKILLFPSRILDLVICEIVPFHIW